MQIQQDVQKSQWKNIQDSDLSTIVRNPRIVAVMKLWSKVRYM